MSRNNTNIYILMVDDVLIGAWTVKYTLRNYLVYNNILDGVVIRCNNSSNLNEWERLQKPFVMTVEDFASGRRFTR
jgi:hypothetical protein